MKSINLLIICFLASVAIAMAQDELPSTGSFGDEITKKGAMAAKKLPGKVEDGESLDMKVKGKVLEVCQSKGCWMTIDMGDEDIMRVKFKDYGFFVPKDAAGKTAVMEGVVEKKIVSVDELKHLAEDAGKSEAEVAKITEPKEEITFVARGVIIK